MARVKTLALRDWIEDEGTPLARRAMVMEGRSSLVAYVGVPSDHPLAGRSYNDMPLDVHGGLTFADEGNDKGRWPAGWYWYGWDYAHLDDFLSFAPQLGGKQWTVEEVEIEARKAMDQLRDLLAETALR